MTFDAILAQVLDLLQHQGRVAYRALKVRFDLDDDYLEALKDELIYARRLAVDEDGRVLTTDVPRRELPFLRAGHPVPSPTGHPAAQLRHHRGGPPRDDHRQGASGSAAYALFTEVQVPRHVECAVQLASEFGVTLSPYNDTCP